MSDDDALRSLLAFAYGKGTDTVLVRETPCPHCGKLIAGSTHARDIAPKPGDVSICVHCAGIAEFTEEMALRSIALDTLEPEEVREQVRSGQALLRMALLRGMGKR